MKITCQEYLETFQCIVEYFRDTITGAAKVVWLSTSDGEFSKPLRVNGLAYVTQREAPRVLVVILGKANQKRLSEIDV